MAYTVRLLGPGDVPAYRALRLEGLALEPAAFASSLEDEQAQADDEWRTRLARGDTFGVFDGDSLVGMATYYAENGAKLSHRGHLVGVYLQPAARGTGAADLLLAEVLRSARERLKFLHLIVNAANGRARRFYERLGFVEFGRDPGGIVVDGTMYEDCLMMLRFDAKAAESDE
jgi:ribosomal protein S18 acetylase RimI-like enzyme